mmetsp:Transcript_30759/g.102476  ORF Transcript_30759/g.102476 Transcript_30759/m.102476 type:complete len:106 (-) Transcript_30759:945-1262(-)
MVVGRVDMCRSPARSSNSAVVCHLPVMPPHRSLQQNGPLSRGLGDASDLSGAVVDGWFYLPISIQLRNCLGDTTTLHMPKATRLRGTLSMEQAFLLQSSQAPRHD